MPRLFGSDVTRAELRKRVGDVRQLCHVRSTEHSDGPERGTRLLDVTTGGGLAFSLLPDRGLDVGDARFEGIPLAWLSPTGPVHPGRFEPEGLGWLRGFHGGLLTSCGLSNVGGPGEDEGETLGLHGRLSFSQARNVCVNEGWDGDEYRMRVHGTLREAAVFGPDLEVRRTWSTSLGSSQVALDDVVSNLGHATRPLMLLYHMNFGWPLVSETTELIAPPCEDVPRDDDAANGAQRSRAFEGPTAGRPEEVFYRDIPADDAGWSHVALVNRELPSRPLGVHLSFRKDGLPILVQWKMMGAGLYVCGLEPSNCRVGGRAAERERGALRSIEPGASRTFALRIRVVSSAAEIDSLVATIARG